MMPAVPSRRERGRDHRTAPRPCPVTLGIVAGLVVGEVIGISASLLGATALAAAGRPTDPGRAPT
ncbi:MAG TPA: hypothetical protein VM264_07620 [Acidimicrobiales bacterium]|nr:hypothetical protein [Acidimicrobiales bacterium]